MIKELEYLYYEERLRELRAVEPLSLEIFKNHLDTVLCYVLQDDPGLNQMTDCGPLQPYPLCHSVKRRVEVCWMGTQIQGAFTLQLWSRLNTVSNLSTTTPGVFN